MSFLDTITGNGILQAGASVLGGLFQSQGVSDTNSANMAALQAQENYQSQMANTTFQRTVADMNAAGLNPMLAYQMQDPSPSGGVPQLASPYSGFLSGAQDAASNFANANLTQANTELAIQKHRREEPEAKVADKVSQVLDKVDQLLPTVVSKAKEVGDVLSSSSAGSASGALEPAAGIARAAGDNYGSLGSAQHAVGNVVNSAVDAKEHAEDYVKRVLANPESAVHQPSAREQAKSSGRRGGTLLRQPRWSPQFGQGE